MADPLHHGLRLPPDAVPHLFDCQAIRDIAQAITTAADLLEAEINEAEVYFTEQLLLGE